MVSVAENPPIYYSTAIQRLSCNSNTVRRASTVSTVSSYREDEQPQPESALNGDSDIDASSIVDTIHVNSSKLEQSQNTTQPTNDADLVQWLMTHLEERGLNGHAHSPVASTSSSSTVRVLADERCSTSTLQMTSVPAEDKHLTQDTPIEVQDTCDQLEARSTGHYYPKMYQSNDHGREKAVNSESNDKRRDPVTNIAKLLQELKEKSLSIQRQNDAINSEIHRAQQLIQGCNNKLLRSGNYSDQTHSRESDFESGCGEGSINSTTETCSCERRASTSTSTGYSSPVDRPQSVTPMMHIKASAVPQLPRYQDQSIYIPAPSIHEIEMPQNNNLGTRIQHAVKRYSVTPTPSISLHLKGADDSSWTESDTPSFTSQGAVLRVPRATSSNQINDQQNDTGKSQFKMNGYNHQRSRSNGLLTNKKLTALILQPFRKKFNIQLKPPNIVNSPSNGASNFVHPNRCISMGQLIGVQGNSADYHQSTNFVPTRTLQNYGPNRIHSVDLLERAKLFQ